MSKPSSDTKLERYLLIGDPHATVEELPDCRRLIDRICEVVAEEKPDVVLFLGDQHHNHAVVRVEVIDFWRKSFFRIRAKMQEYGSGRDLWSLIGNHDMPGDSSSDAHAMEAYMDLIQPINQHFRRNDVLFLSYHHDPEEFVKACNLYPDCKTVVCHQTFDGSKYENGFYAKDGISLDRIPQKHIISGHIHAPQKFGKVWYPGAPRWRISSDANTDRALWMVDFKDGEVVKAKSFDTRGYCRALHEVEDRQGQPEPEFTIMAPYQVTVNIYGTREYVALKRERWNINGYKIRTFVTERAAPRIRESEGITVALQKFVAAYQPKHGTPVERLQKLVAERVNV